MMQNGSSRGEERYTNGGYAVDQLDAASLNNGAYVEKQSSRKSSSIPSDQLCGFGRWKPAFLQKLNDPRFLLATLCLCGLTQGFVINGLIPASIASLERRFRLKSALSGLLASFYDVAFFFAIIPVCHYGGRGHKGHWLSMGMALMSIGSLICIIPHFAAGRYEYGGELREECVAHSLNVSKGCAVYGESTGSSAGWYTVYYLILLLGQTLHGIGATPLYTLGFTYLDENVSQKMSGVYIGIFLAFACLGPALGFIIGGELLKVYGDFDKVDSSLISMELNDPRWYGAWWVGVVMSSVLALLSAIPLALFPRKLAGTDERRTKDVDQASTKEGAPGEMFENLKDAPRQIYMLLRHNPTYTWLVVMQCSDAFLMNGTVTFVPKLLQTLFTISSSWASMLMGLVAVPCTFIGNVLGGWLIKRFRLRCAGVIMLALGCHVLATIMLPLYFLKCDQPAFAGVTHTYSRSIEDRESHPNLGHFTQNGSGLHDSCNADCDCNDFYTPVCHPESLTLYFSACYAGCKSKNADGVYENCDCAPPGPIESGLCEMPCSGKLEIFLAVFGVLILVIFVSAMPVQQAQLRCVQFDQRTLAVGTNWLFVRPLGSIPGAIFFGVVFDKACELWKEICENNASCSFYSSEKVSLYMFLLGIVMKIITCVALLMARCTYKAPAEANSSSTTGGKAAVIGPAPNRTAQSAFAEDQFVPVELSAVSEER